MFFYSPLLSWIVVASLPLYVAISALAAPLFKRRLDEKFRRGAENRPSGRDHRRGRDAEVDGVEPQMQRRWRNSSRATFAASFRAANLGNTTSQTVQLVSKLVTGGDAVFRRQAGHRRRSHRG